MSRIGRSIQQIYWGVYSHWRSYRWSFENDHWQLSICSFFYAKASKNQKCRVASGMTGFAFRRGLLEKPCNLSLERFGVVSLVGSLDGDSGRPQDLKAAQLQRLTAALGFLPWPGEITVRPLVTHSYASLSGTPKVCDKRRRNYRIFSRQRLPSPCIQQSHLNSSHKVSVRGYKLKGTTCANNAYST